MTGPIADPNLKGNIAEAVIAAEATKLGLVVLRPSTEHCRYDMAFEISGRLFRVQCKWARRRGEVVSIKLTSSRLNWGGQVVSKYGREEIDLVAAYCPDTERCYLIPTSSCATGPRFSCASSTPETDSARRYTGRPNTSFMGL